MIGRVEGCHARNNLQTLRVQYEWHSYGLALSRKFWRQLVKNPKLAALAYLGTFR